MHQPEATHSNVAASATVVDILVANLTRLGASIHNDSAAFLTLKMGSAASATSLAVIVGPGAHYELPQWGPGRNVYRGLITGLWSSATGSARVTEYT